MFKAFLKTGLIHSMISPSMKAAGKLVLGVLLWIGTFSILEATEPVSVSGIYPSLSYSNQEDECGTGAVVPWAGRLWVITYGPHLPFGSSDKLYEVTPDYQLVLRMESTGGTHANRMIHKESHQLLMGPYAIDEKGTVRLIDWRQAPGRYTGTARHLSDPQNKFYVGTMEEGLYEVDAHSLECRELYRDLNVNQDNIQSLGLKLKKDFSQASLPGAHGKGLYSGQGVLVYSNNGETSAEAQKRFEVESGSLSEWDGNEWKLIRRNQFTEVTGPGGIEGNAAPESDPLWTVGWDHKSLLLGVRQPETGWSFYRLPKASHSYDGAHGWNTEWPRIRNVGTEAHPDYLMTMHGMFWHFPEGFTPEQSAGIRPGSAYLKVVGDFARWQDHLVFGCDDSARKEFLNKRAAKGNIQGPVQSHSNLWFTDLDTPDQLGPTTAEGALWFREKVQPDQPSEPFLFNGWPQRCAWVKNSGPEDAFFLFEVDRLGQGVWSQLKAVAVPAWGSAFVPFSSAEKGEWIRVRSSVETVASVALTYTGNEKRSVKPASRFKGLAPVASQQSLGGLLYSLGSERRALGVLAHSSADGSCETTGYYELNEKLELLPKEDVSLATLVQERVKIASRGVSVEEGSVLVVDESGRRWRLPLAPQADEVYKDLMERNAVRLCREVATERDLFSCQGTFYELPAENADGYAKIRPIASHGFRVNDYVSYRGLLVMSGVDPKRAAGNPHLIVSQDKKAALWVGALDDLWSLGKPVGQGGPWKDSLVKKGVPSDPYLIGCYDQKRLTVSHEGAAPLTVSVEVDPTGNGEWLQYASYTVQPGQKKKVKFPKTFQARWIRFVPNKDTRATAWLDYR